MKTAKLPNTPAANSDPLRTSIWPSNEAESATGKLSETESKESHPTDPGSSSASSEAHTTPLPAPPEVEPPRPTSRNSGSAVGRVLGGRYQLDEFLASGGMGDIYRARRLHIGDTVAVKVLRPEVIENAQSRQRFYREARAAAMLHHPNAVVIHDFGEDNDGTVYIVMELLAGKSLRQVLVDSGRIPAERANNIIRQACAALEEAHRNGIVHRDIKPDNIMLMDAHSDADYVKLLDFGIAKLRDVMLDTLSLEKNLTNVGTVIGTPHYMSPEQCQGETADARSDIYSLGVVTYEMLTGVTPFIAKTPTGVAIKHVTEKPKAPSELRPEIGSALEAVILKALEKEPTKRQQSAIEFANDFTSALIPEKATAELSSAIPGALPVDSSASQQDGGKGSPQTAAIGSRGYETQFATPEGTEVLRGGVTAPVSAPPKQEDGVASPDKTKPASGKGAEARSNDQLSKGAKGTKAVKIAKAEPAKAEKPKVAPGVTQPKKRSPMPMIAGGIAALILVAALGWFLLSGKPNQAPPVIPSPTATIEATPQVTATPAISATNPPEGMVYVPGGEFTMGRDDGEVNERPAHTETVKSFFIDKNEVTNEEYAKFVAATGYPAPPSWVNGKYADGEGQFPASDVTWDDAAAYAKWSGKRLPTEEEWEFAARGTDGRLYPWGNDLKPNSANVLARQGAKSSAVAVGSQAEGASPFGINDLSGNVWEWTASELKPYPGGTVEELPGYTNIKVIRGGSYVSIAKQATATLRRGWPASRSDWPPGTEKKKIDYMTTGFRCAQDVPQP